MIEGLRQILGEPGVPGDDQALDDQLPLRQRRRGRVHRAHQAGRGREGRLRRRPTWPSSTLYFQQWLHGDGKPTLTPDDVLPEHVGAGVPVGGTVPATLSLTLGAPASFGAVHAGRRRRPTRPRRPATVISTAGDATLTRAADPGHLVNGAFALPRAAAGRAQQVRRWTGAGLQRGGRRSTSGSAISATDAAAHGHLLARRSPTR